MKFKHFLLSTAIVTLGLFSSCEKDDPIIGPVDPDNPNNGNSGEKTELVLTGDDAQQVDFVFYGTDQLDQSYADDPVDINTASSGFNRPEVKSTLAANADEANATMEVSITVDAECARDRDLRGSTTILYTGTNENESLITDSEYEINEIEVYAEGGSTYPDPFTYQYAHGVYTPPPGGSSAEGKYYSTFSLVKDQMNIGNCSDTVHITTMDGQNHYEVNTTLEELQENLLDYLNDENNKYITIKGKSHTTVNDAVIYYNGNTISYTP